MTHESYQKRQRRNRLQTDNADATSINFWNMKNQLLILVRIKFFFFLLLSIYAVFYHQCENGDIGQHQTQMKSICPGSPSCFANRRHYIHLLNQPVIKCVGVFYLVKWTSIVHTKHKLWFWCPSRKYRRPWLTKNMMYSFLMNACYYCHFHSRKLYLLLFVVTSSMLMVVNDHENT